MKKAKEKDEKETKKFIKQKKDCSTDGDDNLITQHTPEKKHQLIKSKRKRNKEKC